MIYIAGFLRSFCYFWVFGIISVLIDLDHVIQVYQNGLELNIENLAFHGSRTLHIPILVLSGCICLISAALFLRFWFVSTERLHRKYSSSDGSDNTAQKNSNPSRAMLSITTDAILFPAKQSSQPTAFLVECPQCSEYIGVIPTNGHTEFPCPYCGVHGYIDGLVV